MYVLYAAGFVYVYLCLMRMSVCLYTYPVDNYILNAMRVTSVHVRTVVVVVVYETR